MKFIEYYDSGVSQDDVLAFSEKFGVSEKVIKIIMSRGYNTESAISNFLWPEKVELQSPFTLKGMSQAVEIITRNISQHKNILVFGDYDVDGISATAILVKAFKKLGVNANYFLPNRYVDGYGLSCKVLDKINTLYHPDLIVTVDCGITAIEEVEYAKKLGIEVVVTDHHEIGETLPNCVVVNTKFTDQEYKFNGLCGTGVAYKLAEALLGSENCTEFLPIVAIATIADIVPLTSENRTLVRLGMANMQALPQGVKQMFAENKVSLTKPDATDIAFKIAPKLNASGRMGDAVDSLKLYFETEPPKIKALINKIFEHNTKRQKLGSIVYEDCKNMLADKDITNMPAIILWKEDWDHGILGIECSKILEEYNRPVFLFTKEGDVLKGSGRSINDVNIHNILTSVSDLLEVFGGHTMAAGLTLKLENFDEFVNRVNAYIFEKINFKVFEPIKYYDMPIKLGDINPKFIEDLKLLEPCGCDNAKPKFLIETDSINIQPLSKASGHANIIIGKNLSLIFFNYVQEASKLNFGEKFKFIFEFQEARGKYVKGIVKDFDFNYNVKSTASKYLECFAVKQLGFADYSGKAKFETYEPKDMLGFVLDCSKTCFGTLFVANTVECYKNFINTYDLGNIFSIKISECCSAGYNSVLLAPKDLSFAKKYNQIIFLDNVLDEAYIYAINKLTNAKIYLPKNGKYSKILLDNLYLNRKHFGLVYQNLLNYENQEFVSVLSVYSNIIKSKKLKINFNNFIIPFYVFKQLGIIEENDKTAAFIYKINKNIKSELNKSSIYNTLNLIKKTVEN
ncbi:MAG: single-stranded-DNA-specific exonuclease RecJ [Clostridiales bacterium]|nr:single-stranded-DNA-specific exonuclease RecJ [Clostridiales bacterium]